MEISIELVQLNTIGTYQTFSDFDFEVCDKCRFNIFYDELLKHVICDIPEYYHNQNSGVIHIPNLGKTLCRWRPIGIA